ncbi:hypothetical protein B0T26DRAFT_724314 [Lasiosphaeria miniovina]|uniref:Heterokaryon incompatibility domain-containing protein n=1 Tax=Lasiosphaeria miniovina TaxID=1954250 RepID=A0AA40DR47_9PEZI|nr:uncharacterized protein B0T26DRAFT_724314 [Lasiosphaeria miniovina]KAK0710197.1 hypothetical protein B0T26DRAFT_724314 [Lasiosphaeria miniovina]
MGKIYQSATSVSVLLPNEDRRAYTALGRLEQATAQLMAQYVELDVASGKHVSVGVLDSECLPKVAEYAYFFQQWLDSANLSTYWRRAWTFQEWIMAKEIDVLWERLDTTNQGPKTLPSIKTLILSGTGIIWHFNLLRQFEHYGENRGWHRILRRQVSDL